MLAAGPDGITPLHLAAIVAHAHSDGARLAAVLHSAFPLARLARHTVRTTDGLTPHGFSALLASSGMAYGLRSTLSSHGSGGGANGGALSIVAAGGSSSGNAGAFGPSNQQASNVTTSSACSGGTCTVPASMESALTSTLDTSVPSMAPVGSGSGSGGSSQHQSQRSPDDRTDNGLGRGRLLSQLSRLAINDSAGERLRPMGHLDPADQPGPAGHPSPDAEGHETN